ncbi:MAG: F0F1 ATP synthase subunit epsilon [Oceanospirillaceae bacterium]|nr:F0F1 ATP synthase subunit epsilon [Oceanospirillaceae bacterium]
MNGFTLHLCATDGETRIEGVTSFVGEDASGSFGILAGRATLITSLVFGLAWFRSGDAPWQYLALPGALLHFTDNQLHLYTRRYLLDADYERISAQLQRQLLAEEQRLQSMKQSLRQMEDEVMRRLTELSQDQASRRYGGG